jgi:hypothetical protein
VWPAPPEEAAFYGLPGKIVRALAPASEADPVALLAQTLIFYGNAVGRNAHFRVGATRHFTNEFVLLCGKTSKSRKGTSWDLVKSLFEAVEPLWSGSCVVSGLSTGEGLMHAVRDPSTKVKKKRKKGAEPEVETDPGVTDKRLLVYEPEFSRVLRQTNRDDNILADVLRQAWDGQTLRTLTKTNPTTATNPHISLCGHITIIELVRFLTELTMANGSGNRFLPVCVARSKLLPMGGLVDQHLRQALQKELREAITHGARNVTVRFDEPAQGLWCDLYESLSADRPGLTGAMLGRAEAHVVRLSMIYALMDGHDEIGVAHLKAALAFWGCVERSVRFIFGTRTGDSLADDIQQLLEASPGGLTRTEISAYLGRNYRSGRIDQALGALLKAGLACRVQEKSGGRPAERWCARRPGQ